MINGCILFDFIIDTDIGLLKFIQMNYNNPNIFIPGILNERNVNTMKIIMTDRENNNPLKTIMIPNTEAYNEADSLYLQFMESHYEEILKLSTQTALFDIIRRSSTMGDAIKFDIICKNEVEHDLILSKFKKYKVTPSVKIVSDVSELDMLNYGSIYVKDIRDTLFFPTLEGKNIIIGNYRFNWENNTPMVPLKEISEKLISSNVLKFIDVYAIDDSRII